MGDHAKRKKLGRAMWVAVAAASVVVSAAQGQDASVRPGVNDSFRDPNVNEFLEKFEGESREVFRQREAIVQACAVKPGMIVADVGAGTGLFSELFARAVGPQGQVVAVDIAPKFLEHIAARLEKGGLRNFDTVTASDDSVNLPPRSIDLAFICDTYHHFEFPAKTMASIRRALKPGGRVVIVDFVRIEGKSSEWVLGHVRAGQEVVQQEIEDAGFVRTTTELPQLEENYLMGFEARTPAATVPKQPAPAAASK